MAPDVAPIAAPARVPPALPPGPPPRRAFCCCGASQAETETAAASPNERVISLVTRSNLPTDLIEENRRNRGGEVNGDGRPRRLLATRLRHPERRDRGH